MVKKEVREKKLKQLICKMKREVKEGITKASTVERKWFADCRKPGQEKEIKNG